MLPLLDLARGRPPSRLGKKTAVTLLQSFSPSLSTIPINDAPLCRFCLSSSRPTTQCSAMPSQLHATLINTGEASLPFIARSPRWHLSNYIEVSLYRNKALHLRCAVPRTPPKWKPASITETTAKRRMSLNHMRHLCLRNTSCKGQQDMDLWSIPLSTRCWLFPTLHPVQTFQMWHKATYLARPRTKWVAQHLLQQIPTGKLSRRQVQKQIFEVCANCGVLHYRKVWRWSVRHDVFLSQWNLSRQDLDRCYVERAISRDEPTQYRNCLQFRQQEPHIEGLEGLHQVNQITTIASGDPRVDESTRHQANAYW